MTNTFRNSVRSLGAATLLAAALPASAQLIAYEGFDYAAGTDNIPGLNGGTGFAAAWGTGAGTESVLASSMAYTDGLGNILQTTGGSGYFTGTPAATSMSRSLSAARGDGTTTWISFVAQRFGPDAYWAASVQFRSGDTGGTTEKITVGEISENNATLGADAANNWWGLFNQAGAGGSAANTADGYLVTNLTFVLLRVDNGVGATDSVRMWLNPNLNVAPDDLSASVTLSGLDLTFDRIRIFSRNGGSGFANAELGVDELRLGETFADVSAFTAVPEPSTYAALLGAATLGFVAYRRRRARR